MNPIVSKIILAIILIIAVTFILPHIHLQSSLFQTTLKK